MTETTGLFDHYCLLPLPSSEGEHGEMSPGEGIFQFLNHPFYDQDFLLYGGIPLFCGGQFSPRVQDQVFLQFKF